MSEHLEYPRILYKGAAVVIVQSDDDKADQLAQGWCLTEAEAQAPAPADEAPEPPKKKGRK